MASFYGLNNFSKVFVGVEAAELLSEAHLEQTALGDLFEVSAPSEFLANLGAFTSFCYVEVGPGSGCMAI